MSPSGDVDGEGLPGRTRVSSGDGQNAGRSVRQMSSRSLLSQGGCQSMSSAMS